MRTYRLSACVLAAILAIVIAFVTGSSQNLGSDFDMLTDAEYEACGIHRLSDVERANLLRLMGRSPAPSYLGAAAFRYLEQAGWETLDIVGAVPREDERTTSSDHLLALRGYRVVELDPPLASDPLLPGRYWVRGSGSAWHVLTPAGDELLFWVQSER